MTDADLKALFAEDEPPSRDPKFSATVMEEVIRRRFVTDMALLAMATTAGAFLIWAIWLTLAPLVAPLRDGLAPLGACITVAAVAVALLERSVIPVRRRNHG